MVQAQVTIDWGRIARWLKTQASDPAVTPPEGVEPHHWAFDREFYIHCRTDEIKVDPLRVRALSTGLHLPFIDISYRNPTRSD